ncbi:hypothetical protein TRFO_35203 [Tritrichomonas foetus]|uniref:Uncharacterized protein n=1 Tax=Tritrichomonas foetus TaxID=1144522 RepID=A0A1J4JLJ6_9EUKA|nr:hypothetical protein TRFO_35203 [Tritrichomonas foetus]|eukprot:OHS98421.1 hypothetical protein TRFO_35203 [Tritrichomonas foetus]
MTYIYDSEQQNEFSELQLDDQFFDNDCYPYILEYPISSPFDARNDTSNNSCSQSCLCDILNCKQVNSFTPPQKAIQNENANDASNFFDTENFTSWKGEFEEYVDNTHEFEGSNKSPGFAAKPRKKSPPQKNQPKSSRQLIYKKGKEHERIKNHWGYGTENEIKHWQSTIAIIGKFGSLPKFSGLRKLLEILVSHFPADAGIKLSRSEKRNKVLCIAWFHENWNFLEPYFQGLPQDILQL